MWKQKRLRSSTALQNMTCGIASDVGSIVCSCVSTQKGTILKAIVVDFLNLLNRKSYRHSLVFLCVAPLCLCVFVCVCVCVCIYIYHIVSRIWRDSLHLNRDYLLFPRPQAAISLYTCYVTILCLLLLEFFEFRVCWDTTHCGRSFVRLVTAPSNF